jgi:hypothetical protein
MLRAEGESDRHVLLSPERTLGENAAKPQFGDVNTPGQDLGRAWRGTAVRRIGKRVINFVAEAATYDAGYNVFMDEGLPLESYPSEIFDGVHSRPAAIRRMNDYDQRQRDLTAQSQRPVMNFILHLGGFALDGAALSPIPIIGGLGHRLGTTLARGVENSILSGMVRCSTAAMLDTTEVELARTLADDYETLGENADSMAANVALAGLLGGAIGGLGGKVRSKAKSDFTDTILEGTEKFKKDVETATSLEDGEPQFPAGEIPTVADVIGDFQENDQSVVAQEFLRKVAISDVVRASTSPCPVTRNFAMAVADSRSLRAGEAATIQAAELVIRTDSNRVINRTEKIIRDSLRKCRRDNRPEFSKIGESDFHGEISDALANGDISSNPYAEECARALRPEIDKMWELWKEADLGGRRKHHMEVHGARVAELEKELEKLEKAKSTDANARREQKMENRREKLQKARAELERVTRGELTDKEWGRVSNDPAYITRVWDIRAIGERTLEFVDRIAKWLVTREKISREDAQTVAYHVKDTILGNSYERTQPIIHLPQVRGLERARVLDIPSSEVRDFLVRDPHVQFRRMVNTIYPDHHLKMRLGTLGTEEAEKAMGEWYNGEIAGGRMNSGDAQKNLQRDVRSVRDLLARIRHMSALSGDALWQSRHIQNLSSASRSVASAIMLGALPSTALYDIGTINMTLGFKRTLGTVIPNLIKFFGSKKFREGMSGDLRSLGLFVDCTFSESTGRLADAYLDPTLSSRLARGARKLSNFSHKWSGAEAVLGAVHHVAAHSLCLHIGTLAEKIKLGEALGKDELHFCNIARLTPERLKAIGGQIEKFGTNEDGLKLWNLEDWTDPAAKKDAIYAVNQMLDLCVLNPGFETPKFGPIGEIFFQFKKFMFAAVDRCLLPTAQKLADENYALIARVIAMVGLGGFRDLLNRAIDGRPMPTVEQFIVQGIATSDVLPFAGDMFKNMHDAFHSDGMLNTISGDLNSFFVPPSVHLLSQGAAAANGLTKLLMGNDRPTKREARAIKQSILFNNHYILRHWFYQWQNALSEPR